MATHSSVTKATHRRILKAAAVLMWALMGAAVSLPAIAADQGPIFIGGALCLTGIQAPLDNPGLKGAELAVDVLNEEGGLLGRKVKFVNLDGKSDPVTVGNDARQLINEGAKLMVAPCDFDMGGPANRAAQAAGIVGISTCGSSPLHGSITLGDKQFTLSMWNTTMGSAAALYAYDQGYRNAYVITDTFISYTKTLSEYFIKYFQQLGGHIIYEDKYTQGAGDFSAQLARMKRKIEAGEKPDVIFISSYMPDLAMIIKTIRSANIDMPIGGGDSYDDSGLFDALGKKFGNSIFFVTHSWMAPGVRPGMTSFLEKYKAKYGEAPDTSFVATGWDTIMVMAEAVKYAGSTNGDAVAKALESHTYHLLTGDLTWSPACSGHEPSIQAPIVKLESGKPQFVGWVNPKNVPKPPYLIKYMESHPCPGSS